MASSRNLFRNLFPYDSPTQYHAWAERRDTLMQWRRAETFHQLLAANVELIRLGFCITPSNAIFPCDRELCEIIPQLLMLNELGMLTIRCQPSEFVDRSSVYTIDGRYWPLKCRQMPYIQFIMDELNHAQELFRILETVPNVKALAFKLNPYEIVENIDPYCVSNRTCKPNFKELVGTGWEQFTDFQLCEESEDEIFHLAALRTIKPWVIGVASTKEFSEAHDILGIVEKTARGVGITFRAPKQPTI